MCRKWRQLAWTTLDLWKNVYVSIGTSTMRSLSLAKSLPGLLCEWLDRSGVLPLNIFFVYSEWFDDPMINMMEIATGSAIKILNSYSGQWRNLHIITGEDIFERFVWYTQPNQLIGLHLRLIDQPSQPPNFMIKSEFTPTHVELAISAFPLTSIDIRWDKTTHIALHDISPVECIEVLRRAPRLEYCSISMSTPGEVSFREPILHPGLRSLHLSASYYINEFLEEINLLSLEQWTQHMAGFDYLPVAAMLSLVKRSGCCPKILNLECLPHDSKSLTNLPQAIPTLEQIHLSFNSGLKVNGMMDDILTRIFCPAPTSGSILVEGHTPESFLPRLQFMKCNTLSRHAPFSWDCIPQLYCQGHHRPLVLKTIINNADITDETAIRLSQLADEGLDLQVFDALIDGCFLANFRKRMCEQGV